MRAVISSAIALLVTFTAAFADVPFVGEFKLPAEQRLWSALNESAAADFAVEFKGVDPAKDTRRPGDFWRQWPMPFSAFNAGLKLPAEQFVLSNLYRDGKLFYPHAQYDPNVDYETFFDLHESLAWLYAFDSPANPLFRNKALRLRAQQLALIHLIGMVENVPGGNIIGGWPIQYGNCMAWNAHVLKLLDDVEPLDPQLKLAWLQCLDHIAMTLDAQGPDVLQTGMGHWNLWPVCGAFYLWQASGDAKHEALFNKWCAWQFVPDAFTSNARTVSGMSPSGYVRYSGIDLGYNGQAKNWPAPMFATLGVDSLVGDFVRRQYQFASFVTLEEPGGALSSIQHMNSHSPQSVPYEQWSAHKHLAYASKIPDAVAFAVRTGYAPSQPLAVESFLAQQEQMTHLQVRTLDPMPFGVRSYPSNYLHLPPSLSAYPSAPPADLSVRTRPMEHLAYAKWFQSPIVRDEFFTRRMPGYHVTIYSGPCRNEISNAGGILNGIGAGGLGQLWTPAGGTMLMAATDLVQKPAMDGDFDSIWSQLPIHAMVAQRADKKIVCTGWTGSLMQADERGREVIIHGGVAPAVREHGAPPMDGLCEWSRRFHFAGSGVKVEAKLQCDDSLIRVAELIPVAIFKDTVITVRTDTGTEIAGPWKDRQPIREIAVRRGPSTLRVVLDRPMEASWGEAKVSLSQAVGEDATSRALQLWIAPTANTAVVRYELRVETGGADQANPVVVAPGAALPSGAMNKPYHVVLEAPATRAVYWNVVAGSLPPGLSLTRAGLIEGTPEKSGNYTIDLHLTDPYVGRPFFGQDLTIKGVQLSIAP
jgi:hypothetical protein